MDFLGNPIHKAPGMKEIKKSKNQEERGMKGREPKSTREKRGAAGGK